MGSGFLVQFRLTPAEHDIVVLASRDVPRSEIIAKRGVKASTFKGQVKSILAKTKARSLDHIALRVVIAELEEAAPFVCPGCYAVAGQACAPGCIDAELRREPDDEDERALSIAAGEPEEEE